MGTDDRTATPPPPAVRDVVDLQTIKGIAFPAAITFRQLIVTGPPGVGKTTEVAALGGWPDEGFVDLTAGSWWRSRILSFRPRQVHLGMPFAGFQRALSVFDPEWLTAASPPALELSRIRFPPGGSVKTGLWTQREKYAFEFLLPPAEKVFEVRRQRSDKKSHPVDAALSVEIVREQLAVYWLVARHLHRAGMLVYLRDQYGGPPKVFEEEVRGPEHVNADIVPRRRSRKRTFLHSVIKAVISAESLPVVEDFERLRLQGTKARIPLHALPLELTLGEQTLQIHADRPLRSFGGDGPRSVVLFDPEEYFVRTSPFVRLHLDDLIRVGGEECRFIVPKMPTDIPPRLEVSLEPDALTLVDLESPTGTEVVQLDVAERDRLSRARVSRLARVRALFGGPIQMLDPDEALAVLEGALAALAASPHRPRDWRGQPGGLVELPPELAPIIVGDLHANLDNLLRILSENRYLDDLEAGRAVLIVLGDAVHNEDPRRLSEMNSSVLIMDVIFKLLLAFPGQFVYLRGNHDGFSHEVTKEGVPQAHLWMQRLSKLRGERYVAAMQAFYDLLPYVATSEGFVACHAGPPLEHVTRENLIDVNRHPRLMHQLMWNRLQSPKSPSGYGKRDVRALQKGLGLKKKGDALIVSHNPRTEEPAELNFGGIKRHHLVYSASRDQMAVFIRIGKTMVPLTYPAEPLLDLTNELASSV